MPKATPKATLRVAIYVRVSTDSQAEEGVSLDAQESRCRQAALDAGATSIELFKDEGISGTTMRRPELQRLLGQLSSFDLVVTWRLDRVSRSLRDTLNFFHALGEANTGFLSVTEALDLSAPAGMLFIGVLSSMNQFFADVVKQNVRLAMHEIAVGGRVPAGRSYGYRRKDGFLVVESAEAEEVRRMFADFDSGASLTRMCKVLNERGVPLPRKGRTLPNGEAVVEKRQWYPSGLRVLLTSPVYVGRFEYGGEQWEGVHDAIVDDALWQRVQARFALRQTGARGPRTHLTQLFRCGLCGGPLAINGLGGNGRSRVHYMLCQRNRLLSPKQRHQPFAVSEDKAAAVVWRHTELLFEDGVLQRAYEVRRAASAKDDKPRQKRIAELTRQISFNLEAAREAAIPFDILRAKNEPLMREREKLQAEAEAAPPKIDTPWKEILDPPAGIAKLRTKPVEVQLIFLKTLYQSVEVFRDHVRFVYVGDVLPPAERSLPRYYSPTRGIVDVGF